MWLDRVRGEILRPGFGARDRTGERAVNSVRQFLNPTSQPARAGLTNSHPESAQSTRRKTSQELDLLAAGNQVSRKSRFIKEYVSFSGIPRARVADIAAWTIQVDVVSGPSVPHGVRGASLRLRHLHLVSSTWPLEWNDGIQRPSVEYSKRTPETDASIDKSRQADHGHPGCKEGFADPATQLKNPLPHAGQVCSVAELEKEGNSDL